MFADSGIVLVPMVTMKEIIYLAELRK